MACGWGFGLNMVDRLVVAYQVKWNLISSINIILYMLPHNLPKKVRLRILANQRILKLAMRVKSPYFGFFWSAFSRIWTKYGPEELRIQTHFTQCEWRRRPEHPASVPCWGQLSSPEKMSKSFCEEIQEWIFRLGDNNDPAG